jgi:phosphomannomutase/phosphoglucomutase
MAHIAEHIFRAYDIRGRESQDELNEESLELIGRAYGTYLARKGVESVVVGHDSRATSDAFSRAAIRGLLMSGRKVLDLGTCLTPMMYWAQYHFKTEGGFMITASHNPVGWNGAKCASGYSQVLGGEELKKLYQMVRDEDFESHEGSSVEEVDIKEEYFIDLLSRVNVRKKFRMVVNTGNGTAGLFAPELLRRTHGEVIERNTTVDPTYPNYTPNPAETEMMEDTGRVVLERGADFGVAFDGDGDRVGIVDEKGETVSPDRLLIFLAKLLLKEKEGATVVYDVTSTQAIDEAVTQDGGKAVMSATGHSNMKATMAKVGADLGGEASGHMFFTHGYYGFDDASYAALKLVEFFSQQDVAISELVATLPQYVATPRYYVEATDEAKFDVVKELTQQFKDEGYEVADMDGARVSFEGGWGIVRASNTTPALVVRCEAKTEERLDEILQIFKDKLSAFEGVGGEWKAG